MRRIRNDSHDHKRDHDSGSRSGTVHSRHIDGNSHNATQENSGKVFNRDSLQALHERADRVRMPISRRSLLKGIGGGALSIALPAWSPLEAVADTVQPYQRFIGFFLPNGTVKSAFFPAAGAAVTSAPILRPLQAFDNQLLVLKGVHMNSREGANKPGGPHMKGPGAMFTGGWLNEGGFSGAGGPAGYANRISVDQVLANHIGKTSPFRSLEFGIVMRGQEPLKYISYRGSNQPNPAVDDPWQMYSRVFSNMSGGGTSTQLDPAKKSVIDYIKSELATLNNRLPSADKVRLDAHLTHIRSIEQQLTTIPRACSVPNIGSKIDIDADSNFPTIAKLQLDLMFHAHACGLTRVSTFMWTNADSWQKFPWLGINEEHHALSHETDSTSINKLIKINTWYSERLAYFLGLMKNTTEANGRSMLDNSLVLVGNEIGEGPNHTYKDIPWLLAGSAGGYFKQGQMIEFAGVPHNNLMLTALHAFGLTSATTFGAPENCTGSLSALRV